MQERAASTDVVIRPTKPKSAKTLALGIGVVVEGGALVVLGAFWIQVVGALNVGVGAFLIGIGMRQWRGDPLVTLTDDGLVHPVFGLITWDEIEALPIELNGNVRMLSVKVRDEGVLARRRGWRWWRAALSDWGSPSLVRLPSDPASMTPEELRFKIEGRAGRTYPHEPDG
jgi:hypothetical protein